MIIIIGLIILIAAVVAGLAGVLSNSGSNHALTHHFAVFGYHVTGSTGTLFLYGIVVGALAVFGLSMLLAGARRSSRRGSEARRGLMQSRRETAAVTQDRDDLIDQRETARAYNAGTAQSDDDMTVAYPGAQVHAEHEECLPALAARRGPDRAASNYQLQSPRYAGPSLLSCPGGARKRCSQVGRPAGASVPEGILELLTGLPDVGRRLASAAFDTLAPAAGGAAGSLPGACLDRVGLERDLPADPHEGFSFVGLVCGG
jgi:hypothetical protein